MVMNTKRPTSADFILHAEEKGRGRLSGPGRGIMVRYFDGLVGEYSSYRLVYDNKRNFAEAYTRSVRFSPISVRTTVALIKSMQDRVWKDAKVC